MLAVAAVVRDGAFPTGVAVKTHTFRGHACDVAAAGGHDRVAVATDRAFVAAATRSRAVLVIADAAPVVAGRRLDQFRRACRTE